MAPATGTALLLLVAFVLPGFATLVARERTWVIPEATTPFERLLLSLSYSARIYGVLLVAALLYGWGPHDVAALYHGHKGLASYALLGLLALLVLPLLFSETGRYWRYSRLRPPVLKRLGISEGHTTPSAWDHFFGSNRAALVRATLDDGRVVGGYYSEGSLAGYSEQTQDLFLEESWVLDEDSWFVGPAPATLGLWLAHDHIVSLEVYTPPTAAQARLPALSAAGTMLLLIALAAIGRRRGRAR